MPLLLAFAVVAGILNTLQSGSNSELNKHLQHPIATAMAVYLGGLLILLVGWIGAQLIGKGGFPASDHITAVPWWGWLGGFLGMSFVFGTMLVAPKVGRASILHFQSRQP